MATPGEINEAVARKLHGNGPWISADALVHGDQEFSTKYKPYSTSIAAAFEILTDHCDTWEIFCGGSTVDVTLGKKYSTASAEADTAPAAICLAFLKMDLPKQGETATVNLEP